MRAWRRDEAARQWPSSWTVPNPSYIADYVPRYYQFGPGDEMGATVVGQPGQRLAGEVEAVGCATRAIGCRGTPRAPGAAGVGQGDQVPGKIAAVDGGNIAWFKRPEGCGFVPVVKVAIVFFHPPRCGKGGFDSADRIAKPKPAKFPRTGNGQQVKPDVGW